MIRTLAAFGLEGERIEGLTGVWLTAPPRKIASIGVHISRWVTTHGYALNVDLDPAPFTEWITACGLEDARSRRWRASSAGPDGRRGEPAAAAALGEVFGLALEELPAATARPVAAADAREARRRCSQRSRLRLATPQWRHPCPSPSVRAAPSG